MSYVATVAVLVSYYEDDENIRAACEPFGQRQDCLVWASSSDARATYGAWGGTKAPESDVLLGAFNYLDRDALIARLKAALKEPFTVCISEEGRTRPWEVETYGT